MIRKSGNRFSEKIMLKQGSVHRASHRSKPSMAHERVRLAESVASLAAPLDRVFVHDLVLDCEIGVYTHEQGVTQRVRFSVDVEVKPAALAVEDNIERVLDYDMIIQGIKTIVGSGHLNLTE